MNKLKYNEIHFRVVDYRDWDKFVCEIYGTDKYDITSDQELSNDSAAEYYVEKEKKLDKHDRELIKKLKSGQYVGFATRTIFQDLANRDIIEDGNYLIKVCW